MASDVEEGEHLFSKPTPEDARTKETPTAEQYKDLIQKAESCFLSGYTAASAHLYSQAMELEPLEHDLKYSDWQYQFLMSCLETSTLKIACSRADSSGYLQKAAALILLDRWAEAREILSAGMENCSDTRELRLTIGNLNKLELQHTSAE